MMVQNIDCAKAILVHSGMTVQRAVEMSSLPSIMPMVCEAMRRLAKTDASSLAVDYCAVVSDPGWADLLDAFRVASRMENASQAITDAVKEASRIATETGSHAAWALYSAALSCAPYTRSRITQAVVSASLSFQAVSAESEVRFRDVWPPGRFLRVLGIDPKQVIP